MSNSQDDFVAAFMRKKEQLQSERMKAFLEGMSPEVREAVTSAVKDKPKWSSLEQMNRELAKKRVLDKETAKNKKEEQAKRKKQIEYELDIIRGIVPTPKGYKLDPKRVKPLMKELKELENA